jgi:hypothetical protein
MANFQRHAWMIGVYKIEDVAPTTVAAIVVLAPVLILQHRQADTINFTTVRNNWPHYFTNVCRCNGNYAGFDCSRCKYGYYGSDCNKKMVLARRPISELSPGEWEEYIDTLIMSKSHPSGYFVFLEEPEEGPNYNISALDKTVVNSLYDLFIWQHHYAAKDNENEECKPILI